MALLRVEGLPAGALEAAALFHAEVLPGVEDILEAPPLKGEVAARSADGGVSTSARGRHPSVVPDGPTSPLPGEELDCLLIVFPPADHTHRGWRLAAVQELARKYAPRRINAVASADQAATTAAAEYLAHAPGVTGQLLQLDGNGAGEVLSS